MTPRSEPGDCPRVSTDRITSATASAWEPTPWRAVQHAAWEAMRQAEEGSQ